MSSERPQKSLIGETEGAILILGIVMGALLVAALWNIASVGDAAIWREHLQDGADATAFENAVWNARGMNVLALLNILMSMVMAVLVVWRAIEIFLGTLLAIIAIACIVTILFPNPLTGAACELGVDAGEAIANALLKMGQKDQRVSTRVHEIIAKLQKAQHVVASAIPLLGVAEGSASSSAAYGMPAIGLSASLIPSFGGENNVIQYRVGIPVSLPVQEDSEWKLCAMAGEFVPNQIAGVLERIAGGCTSGGGGLCAVVHAVDSGPIKGLAGGIAGSLPTIFCGKGGIPPAADKVINDTADEVCKKAGTKDSSATDEKYKAEFGAYWKGNPKKFDDGACKKAQLKKANTKYYADKGANALRVWDYATNANFFMQSWGLSFYKAPNLGRDDRALEIGDGEKTGNLVAAPTDSIGSAEAEMYWDCDKGWHECKGDSMWQMRWRARLRRYHNPGDMLLRATKDIAVASLVDGLDKQVGKVPKLLNTKFNVPAFVTGNMWSTYWSSTYIKGGLFTMAANKTVGKWIEAHAPRDENSTVLH